jgi:AcrR family transcriptional regulator
MLRSKSKESPVPPLSIATRLAQNGILQAAVDVFSRHGFSATRVEDLLIAAKIARRTFYKHFANKEEVLAALYQFATQELLEAIRSAGILSGSPLDAVHRALDTYLDYHVANARLVGVLVQQALRFDSPLAPLRIKFRNEVVQLLDQAVRASTGEVYDPMLYVALLAALEGLSLDLITGQAGPAEVARAKKVMHLLLHRTLEPGAKVEH